MSVFTETILAMKFKCPKQIKTNKQDNKLPSQGKKKTKTNQTTPQTKTRMYFEGIKVALNFITTILGAGRKHGNTFSFHICILKYVLNLIFDFILILILK